MTWKGIMNDRRLSWKLPTVRLWCQSSGKPPYVHDIALRAHTIVSIAIVALMYRRDGIDTEMRDGERVFIFERTSFSVIVPLAISYAFEPRLVQPIEALSKIHHVVQKSSLLVREHRGGK